MVFISDFDEVVASLMSIPNLKSLYINLEEEEQVDTLMRTMDDLEFLNGIPVEREEVGEEEEDSFRSDPDMDEEEDDIGRMDQKETGYDDPAARMLPGTIIELEEESGTDDDINRENRRQRIMTSD